jgi:2-oxo-4-hydroxy-4-carboxy-5-ureidoimidazoline decarboxylase
MVMVYTIATLNELDQAAFVEAVGSVFEQTPAIAAAAWQARPFADRVDLHQKMVAVVEAMSLAEQLALIQAHPDLGSRAKMAEASQQEQAGAGLDQLSPTEYEQFQRLNQAYRARFGFPFIIAVKNHTKTSILQAFEQRLNNVAAIEQQQALLEIAQIAYFRIDTLIA